MKPYTKFEEWHLEKLADPTEALAYLKIALEDYEQDLDSEAFLLALRDVAKAQEGMKQIAKPTNLNSQHLYKAISSQDNPKLDTIASILQSLGYRLSIEPLD